MIRKLLFPALAAAVLAGCMTSGYQYRGGSGDYYYGQPSTQYRYYGAPYGSYGYGYPGWGGSIGYGYYSNGYAPYGYYGHGGYPYYPYYPYRPPVVIVQPDPGTGGGDNGSGDSGYHTDHITDRPQPPWRDLGNVPGRTTQPGSTHTGTVRLPGATGSRAGSSPPRPVSMPLPPPAPRVSTGSRSGTVTGGIVRPGMVERDKRRKPIP